MMKRFLWGLSVFVIVASVIICWIYNMDTIIDSNNELKKEMTKNNSSLTPTEEKIKLLTDDVLWWKNYSSKLEAKNRKLSDENERLEDENHNLSISFEKIFDEFMNQK